MKIISHLSLLTDFSLCYIVLVPPFPKINQFGSNTLSNYGRMTVGGTIYTDTEVCSIHTYKHTETLTCPGGSLRNSDEVASDLAWSEVDVCETQLLITTIGHSVR